MTVELTSLDRVLYPATGFTKGDLVDYYRRIAPALLPELRDRPLTLGRWPDGVHRPGFAQTECRGRPEWMAVREVRLRSGEVRRQCVAHDLRSLLWIANQGTIELHTFPGSGDEDDGAPVLVLDIDPEADADVLACSRVALELRERLARRDLAARVKTSGAAGLHVPAALDPPWPYRDASAVARELAAELAASGVTVDWGRNGPRQTLVTAWSLRALDWPTVSVPVGWAELEAALAAGDPAALVFTPRRALERSGAPPP